VEVTKRSTTSRMLKVDDQEYERLREFIYRVEQRKHMFFT
jgi:hypothetical protein